MLIRTDPFEGPGLRFWLRTPAETPTAEATNIPADRISPTQAWVASQVVRPGKVEGEGNVSVQGRARARHTVANQP